MVKDPLGSVRLIISRVSEEESEMDTHLASAVSELLEGTATIVEVNRSAWRAGTRWLLKDPAAPDGYRTVSRPLEARPLSTDAKCYPPADRRTPDYPKHIPFLKATITVVDSDGSNISVYWPSPLDAVTLLRSIIDESRLEGWVVSVDPEATGSESSRFVEMSNGDKVRVFCLITKGLVASLAMFEESRSADRRPRQGVNWL
jgi:hypothetical protein